MCKCPCHIKSLQPKLKLVFFNHGSFFIYGLLLHVFMSQSSEILYEDCFESIKFLPSYTNFPSV